MNKTFATLCTSALLGLITAGTAYAADGHGPAASAAAKASAAVTGENTGSSAKRDNRLARADAAFLRQAAQNGLAEVEGSKLALTKATSAQVKTFAQQMVDDHTKTHEELKTLATSKGVELPTEPSVAQRAKLKLLSARDGVKFDQHYAESLGVKAHEDTVKLFKEAARDARDTDVKAFAAKTLPALEHHLQMARDLKVSADAKEERADKADAKK